MPTSNPTSASPQQQENQGEAVSPSGQQMSKQTLLALSAIPKPRLTDNESWITKKKPESQRRDYSKHWLHQASYLFLLSISSFKIFEVKILH